MTSKRRRMIQANQAEILRSYQRDNLFVRQLNDHLQDILVNFKLRKCLGSVSSETYMEILYFILTHGMGNQTLGEEYTGIVPVKLRTLRLQPLSTMVCVTLVESFGQRFVIKLIDQFLKWLNSPQCSFTSEAILCFNKLSHTLKSVIPILLLAHQGIFYITGRYPSIGKRLFKIDYAKVYGKRATHNVNWGIKLLGMIMLAQCALRLWQIEPFISSTSLEEPTRFVTRTNDTMNCNLCLEQKSTTTTVCGHLYCWSCIVEWLQSQHYCPLCREPISPSRVIRLMNL